jgi:hypothetical protein
MKGSIYGNIVVKSFIDVHLRSFVFPLLRSFTSCHLMACFFRDKCGLGDQAEDDSIAESTSPWEQRKQCVIGVSAHHKSVTPLWCARLALLPLMGRLGE